MHRLTLSGLRFYALKVATTTLPLGKWGSIFPQIYLHKYHNYCGSRCIKALVIKSEKRTPMERTFVMVKPDGVERRLVGEVISRIERKGYGLESIRVTRPRKEILEMHYSEHVKKAFFGELINYMMSGNIVAMVWSGKDAVNAIRRIIGETDPLKSNPGTIRGDFCIEVGMNLIHGSDSVESAKREIEIWFGN